MENLAKEIRFKWNHSIDKTSAVAVLNGEKLAKIQYKGSKLTLEILGETMLSIQAIELLVNKTDEFHFEAWMAVALAMPTCEKLTIKGGQ